MQALIIDGDRDNAHVVAESLQKIGLRSSLVQNGDDGLAAALQGTYSVIILDALIPGRSGFDICRKVREAGLTTPMLCLSSKSGEFDEIEALELGADDYVRKPAQLEVLNARITALLRRPHSITDATTFAGITYDSETREARIDGSSVQLTPREGDLLAALIRSGERPVSKTDLLKSVWGTEFSGNPNVVEVYIRYLRQKLGATRVDTIPRTGYRLNTHS